MDDKPQPSPPPPPPKLVPPPLVLADSSALALPPTPTTPSSPARKPGPLADLIDSEKAYVDQLTGIIRKVAAAWSRSNLPPPDLDTMFRSIEGVYKASRAFHNKLKDLGANPSSPKALGDLLMRWIEDLRTPYSTYCAKYRCGFDSWEPIQSNPKLPTILATFSASNPPPLSATASNASDPPVWTLDDLFLLPKARVKYYKKLYNRLLKSTAPGKSDHKLLLGALESLDQLLNTLDSRSSVTVGHPISSAVSPAPSAAPPLSLPHEDEDVVIDLRTQSVIHHQNKQIFDVRLSADTHAGSETSSARDSAGERSSRETASTSLSRTSSATLSMPISDLERRLSTQRTLDIFTMKPKAVRLQMAPPSLTFTRALRLSTDVVVRFTPQTTGAEIVHSHAHIFLLSDLFLMSERMTPQERSQQGPDGADMWLSYPPLAGKVLRVFEIPDQPRTLRVVIMRKETLFIESDSLELRNTMLSQLRECIEFSQSLPPPSKTPPPPVPSLNGINRGPGQQPFPNPASSRSPSPSTNRPFSPPRQKQDSNPPPYRDDGGAAESMVGLVLSPDAQIQQGAQRVPSMQLPGPMYPRNAQMGQHMPNGHGPVPVQGPTRTTSSNQGPPRPGSGPPGPGSIFPGNGPGSIFNGHHPTFGPGPGPRGPDFGPGPRGPGPGPGGYPPGGQFGQGPPFQPGPNQPFPPNGYPPGGLPNKPYPPSRPPSEPGFQGRPPMNIHKSPSGPSLASQYSHYEQNPGPAPPPMPAFPGGHPPSLPNNSIPRSSSYSSLPAPQPRLLLPSLQPSARSVSMAEPSFDEPSPPNSPVQETPQQLGPVTSTISAQMKCKVFLQQQHSQWKSLGSAKLKLYRQDPTNVKQLVVEQDNKEKSIIISTIVLTDGVERVGKTGVAIELSDKGQHTGIIYMIQLRNESSAGGLFDSLIQGSDRSARG
ncbi:hypothetical protein H0H87_003819 [Tephrocybe sp. NHM501043]|nr:hypothetical protein H0H87_003819 [Tephrocybe sp. NHM501043]